MARKFAEAFYNSKKWKKARESYILHRKSVDGGMCESCHQRPGHIVHHKTELTPENIADPDVALNFENFKFDCHVCHNKENKRKDEVDGLVQYEFDEEGQLIAQSPPESQIKNELEKPRAPIH